MHHVGRHDTTQEHGGYHCYYSDDEKEDAQNGHPIGGDGFYHGGKTIAVPLNIQIQALNLATRTMRKQNVEQFNANGHPFKVVIGNLIEMAKEGRFDVIAHGCNCHCAMGAGIAKIIKLTWPEAYRADLATKKGDRSKLGTYSMAVVDGLTIVNMYTQYNYTRDKVDVEYPALEMGLKRLKEEFTGRRIGLPMIGAGLAGGNWGLIKEIIGNTLHGEDVTVVILEKDLKPPPDEGPEATEDQFQW